MGPSSTVLRPFFDAYRVVADQLVRWPEDREVDTEELLERSGHEKVSAPLSALKTGETVVYGPLFFPVLNINVVT